MSETGQETEIIERKPRVDPGITLDEIEQRQEGREKGPTPEEALAQAQEQIKTATARAEAEAAERARVERELNETRKTAVETQQARVSDQEAAISNAIEAGKSAKQAAVAKLRAAREAGDFEAEVTAQSEFNAADFRLMQATNAKTQFDAWKAKQPRTEGRPETQQQPQASGPAQTPEVRQWLADHPLYGKDDEYTADANVSHDLALKSGCVEGSKAYVDFIDARLGRLYGDGHGNPGAQRQTTNGGQVSQQRQSNRTAASTAAPPSRGSDGGGRSSGGIEYRHDSGVLRLVNTTDAKGQMVETVQGTIPADWVEAAKWSKMTPVAYAVEQLKVQSDIKNGTLRGLDYGESGTYR